MHSRRFCTTRRVRARPRWTVTAMSGGERALLGVPVTIKDVICTRGIATTAGSRILSGFQPPYNATVVTRLLDAGAGHPRQNELRRIRDGIVDRTLRVRTDAESLGNKSHSGRLERRCRRSGRGSAGTGLDCLRYRGLHSPAGGVLWSGRAETDLRPRFALRPSRVRVVTRSDRPPLRSPSKMPP